MQNTRPQVLDAPAPSEALPVETLRATLEARGGRYGAFTGHARIAQSLKRAMQDTPNWNGLSDDLKESLEMIQHKIARALNGDPEYADNFVDIAGYATLVADRLSQQEAANAE